MKLEINGHTIETEEYVEKWTNLALAQTPATDKQIISSINFLYKEAKLPKPERVVIFREWEDFRGYNWASVRASVSAYVSTSVCASVWASVSASVRDSVRASVSTSVCASVSASVCASVSASVCASVWASVRAGLWYWAEDLAYANVFADCGVLDTATQKKLAQYTKALSTQRLAVLTEDTAYVLVAPIIRRNEAGRLHSLLSPAVQWGNSGVYYLNGVEVPKDIFIRIPTMTADEVFKIENAEVRRVVYEVMDKTKMKELDNYKVLDEVKDDGYGYSMKIIEFTVDRFDEPFRYLNCFCPTTGREYFLETKRDTCWSAKMGSFGLEDDYRFTKEA